MAKWSAQVQAGGITFTGEGGTPEAARENILVKLEGARNNAKKLLADLDEHYVRLLHAR